MSARDAGYTLVEMLAALAVIGLAVAALSQATLSIGRLNRAALTARDGSAARGELRTALAAALAAGDAPQALQGTAQQASWPCAPKPCAVSLSGSSLTIDGPSGKTTFTMAERLELRYLGETGVQTTWPPPQSAPLLALLVAAKPAGLAAPTTLVSLAVDAQQPLRCDYDSISMRCRTD